LESKDMANPAWKPGVSGNPKGRPSVGNSLAYALRQKFTPDRIVEIAVDLVASDDPKVRLATLQFIADRAYGKVPTTADITVTEGPGEATRPIDWSAVSVDRRRALMGALEEVTTIAETVDADESVEH
jgi:hypothetical protein